MIPILDAPRICEADAYTIAHEPVLSIDLMERAAVRCTKRILEEHYKGRFGRPELLRYAVVVGMGNNGGDGLAIARALYGAGVPVRVLRAMHRQKASPDHAVNHQRLLASGVTCTDFGEHDAPPSFARQEVIVDALLGTGITEPITGLLARIVKSINASGRPVIAVDMPSGLFTEDNGANDPTSIIRAHLTLSLELPKLAMLLPDNDAFVGEWTLVPIGLDRSFINQQETAYHLMEEADAMNMVPVRPRSGHKGTFGHACILAGGEGRMGAALLATNAALRSGVGLVTAQIPRCGLALIQSAAPEAMCIPDADEVKLTGYTDVQGTTALGIGPAIGTHNDTASLLKRMIQDASVPMVIDADALTILAADPTWITFLPPGTVLTPHPKEFDRLAGAVAESAYVRLQAARELATRTGCIVALKGHHTAICDQSGGVTFNATGNPGMAKGGSGDVLTGLLTGLLAQGIEPLTASKLGVHLHGLAGDLAAQHRGMDGMTAQDIIAAIPEAWVRLRNASEESLQ